MQMPLFAAAHQQQSTDDLDFQELFREYFNEDPDTMGYSNPTMAQLQAQAATMGGTLPTGTGIRTAFHGGGQQPAMKRSRIEENLYLPTTGGLSYANTGIANAGLGGFSGQLAAGLSGAGLGSLGQNQMGSNMGFAMGMGSVGGASGGMAVSNMNYGTLQTVDKEALEKQMTAERRLRNREHAKRSRVRKKFMLESLQEQVRQLQEENSDLRLLIQKHIPDNALKIIDDCCTSSPLFGLPGLDGGDKSSESDDKGTEKTALIQTDFSLIESLTSGQQNFVLSDPRLPDNPIVFATPGFYELTGYTREQVLGRNCRFLQGPGTDPKAVDVIRSAIANGNDATVCLLNYKADGTPFWNQFFVAALRDADNCIVNYVGSF
jgi:PAS domain S-box-containing protein